MLAQVLSEVGADPPAEDDQSLEVGARQQGSLVTGQVEVLEAQPGEWAGAGQHGIQTGEVLDLLHAPERSRPNRRRVLTCSLELPAQHPPRVGVSVSGR